MDRREYLPFIIIILIFLVVKLSILILGIDKLIYGQECLRALIAKQLIDGSTIPFFDLQSDSYSGGSLVVGMLMVPFFKLLGQNLISVKLVALLFSLAVLISLYLFCNKFFNRRVAIVTSLLFILSPPLFTKYSLITMGFHTESILFSILLLFVFFEIFFNDKKDNLHFILLGLIAGFGVWFTYIFSITLFTCLLFWFLLDRGFFLKKNFLVFLIFFICGFSPWIYYNLSHSFGGLSIRGRAMAPPFSTDHLIFSLTKIKDLLLNDIRNSFLFEESISLGGKYLSTFYYLIFIVSFLVLFWLNRWSIYQLIRRVIPLKRFQISPASISKETFFLIYIVIFSLIYSLSNFKISAIGFGGYRYLLPLYPFIFIIIALFLGKIQEGGMKGKVFVSNFLLIILISIGLVSNLKFISFNKIDIRFLDIDYVPSYIYLGCRIGMMYGDDIDKCITLINRVEERYRFPLYQGLGSVIGRQFENDIDEGIGLVNRVEERYRTDVYRGISIVFNWNRYKGDIEKCIGLINRVEERYKFHFYRKLGFVITQQFENEIEKCISLLNQVEERYRPYFYRGLGIHFIRDGYREDKCSSLINQAKERYRPYVYEGFGEGIVAAKNWRIKGFVSHCVSLMYWVEEGSKIAFYKGLGRGFYQRHKQDFGVNRYKAIIEREIENKYIPYVYQGLESPF